MTTETLREAVARAIFEKEGYCSGEDDDPFRRLTWEEAAADDYPVLAAKAREMADAAIRTVLERLREPSDALLRVGVLEIDAVSEDPDGYPPTREQMRAGWQSMLDAAVREVG